MRRRRSVPSEPFSGVPLAATHSKPTGKFYVPHEVGTKKKESAGERREETPFCLELASQFDPASIRFRNSPSSS
jgi:hypothetical protein